MKKIIELVANILCIVVIIGAYLLPVVVCLAIAYLVAISDLPAWFKFFLLRG